VPDEFSAEDGTLTPSMKMKRRIIEDRYRVQIDELYSTAEAAAVAYQE
jgi:long-chain acyl-CoA synthetase